MGKSGIGRDQIERPQIDKRLDRCDTYSSSGEEYVDLDQ